MIEKTLSGFPVLDESFGGIFSNRSFLVSGPSQSGKTIMGLRFTQQGLEQNERCLYLSTIVAGDLRICAEPLGFDMAPAIESGDLTLLEYESFIPGNGAPGLDMLPPEGFDQLRDIIHANSIERVVLDTVLPWVSVKQPDRMPEQVFSFTRSFDRLGVTTMLTLPKPVSNMSFRLKKSIEDVVPISILLNKQAEDQPATVQVVKYLGEKLLGGKTPYNMENGHPLSEDEISKLIEESSEDQQAPESFSPSEESSERTKPSSQSKSRPRFSAVHRETSSPSPSGYSPPNSSQPSEESQSEHRHEEEPAEEIQRSPLRFSSVGSLGQSPSTEASEFSESKISEPNKTARLSSIWKPQPSADEENMSDA